jgi:endoglucanase
MQTKLGTTELDLVSGYADIVDYITHTLGDYVMIDPHNNDQGLRYDGKDAKRSDFVKLWTGISNMWHNNSLAIFGLYNEPRYGHEAGMDGYFDPDAQDKNGSMIEHWRQWMQEAIDEVRRVGAKNLILVPGLHWTTCRDWSGANWWGEALDVYSNAGNTRLAALTDPAMNIAYDVHQYMDDSFTGVHDGCGGHGLAFGKYAPGADGGLELTIQWAKTYNKKLMMTEIGSWEDNDGTGPACKANMSRYLQRMNDSGVFLGYQVWQFGCPTCDGDLWSAKPLNIDWYRFTDFHLWAHSQLHPGSPSSFQLRLPNYAGQNKMWCVGLNAAGFDLDARNGRNGKYTIPDKEVIRYFHKKGSNCFRLPILWERLQLSLGTTLAPVGGFEEIVNFITYELGDYVIIDPHNQEQGLQFEGLDAKRSDFVNLWTAISTRWHNNPLVIFGLYNAPRYGHEEGIDGYFDTTSTDQTGAMITHWFAWAQEAINAIRNTTATNLILVTGLRLSISRDWSGGQWWGESLDGVADAGNTRLAALVDPAMNIAYDVHQYMDDTFRGEQDGCNGHDKSYGKYLGADEGLNMTIQWAKTYNKKLMMTEIGSWEREDGSSPICKAKMSNFIEMMNKSGVFLGYQVWQFGCEKCKADLWSKRPLNFYWYRLSEFGNPPGQMTTTLTTTTITTTSTNTTTTTTTTSTSTTSTTTTTLSVDLGPRVLTIVTISNIDFDKVQADPLAQQELERRVKQSFLTNLPTGYTEGSLTVTLSKGSVIAKVYLLPLLGIESASLKETLKSNKEALVSTMLLQVKTMPEISNLLETDSDLTVEATDPVLEMLGDAVSGSQRSERLFNSFFFLCLWLCMDAWRFR